MISCLPSIATAREAMHEGSLTASDLVEFCLSRIEQFEPTVKAWVLVDSDAARRDAKRLDELGGRGNWVGPLHGIPLGIKDIVDVAGFPTKAGSAIMRSQCVEHDSTVAERLRRSGAILLGKTVTTEFACFHPAQTANPWNPTRTPGGSSSGSAAAVASQMCMAAIGSQTGGSIIRPASYCGIAGFKPTKDVVPVDGVVPVSKNLDHVGPLARSVSDLAELFAVMADAAAPEPATHENSPPPLRAIESYFLERAAAPCRNVIDTVLARLLPDSPPRFPLPDSFSEVHSMHRRIMSVDAAEYHQENFQRLRSKYSTTLAAMLDEGLTVSGVDYCRALRHQAEFRQEIAGCFEDESVIAVTPATPAAAPGIESTGDPSFNSPWTYAGLPAVTIPCGLDPSGLPVGLQLIAGHHRDHELLQAAAWCESRLDLNLFPPLEN